MKSHREIEHCKQITKNLSTQFKTKKKKRETLWTGYINADGAGGKERV